MKPASLQALAMGILALVAIFIVSCAPAQPAQRATEPPQAPAPSVQEPPLPPAAGQLPVEQPAPEPQMPESPQQETLSKPSFSYTTKSKGDDSAAVECTDCTEDQCRQSCQYEMGTACLPPKLFGFGSTTVGNRMSCECSCTSLG